MEINDQEIEEAASDFHSAEFHGFEPVEGDEVMTSEIPEQPTSEDIPFALLNYQII